MVPSTFEEDLDKSSFSHPYEYVMENAKQKTLEVAKRLSSDQVCHSVCHSLTAVDNYPADYFDIITLPTKYTIIVFIRFI